MRQVLSLEFSYQ